MQTSQRHKRVNVQITQHTDVTHLPVGANGDGGGAVPKAELEEVGGVE
jgi:hypothetical protein